MTDLLPSYVENGVTLYPVRHATGQIVCSLSRESQQLWQEYADKQREELKRRPGVRAVLERAGLRIVER